MCRRKNECSELGNNPHRWNRECLLRPPTWISHDVDKFVEALEKFLEKKRDDCITLLSEIRSRDIADWFIEHGQMSGRHRKNLLNIPRSDLMPETLRDPLRAPRKFQDAVFKRDNFHCRYCGSRLVSQTLIKLFVKTLAFENFQKGPTNLATHGIIHATWPVADHVVPWSLGGATHPNNLVSSCGACNYGKDGFTCEQLGISNPLKRPPVDDGWDGLVSKEALLII